MDLKGIKSFHEKCHDLRRFGRVNYVAPKDCYVCWLIAKVEELEKRVKVDTDISEYPNLTAILNGTIAGNFRDWPAVKPELVRLVAEVGRLEVGLQRIKMGRVYYSNRTDERLTRLELMTIANTVLKGGV